MPFSARRSTLKANHRPKIDNASTFILIISAIQDQSLTINSIVLLKIIVYDMSNTLKVPTSGPGLIRFFSFYLINRVDSSQNQFNIGI